VEHSVERKKEPVTFTDQLRVIFKGVLDPIAKFFYRLGVHPNTLTYSGLVGTAVGAYFVARGQFLAGGLVILLIWPIDAVDGAVARLRGEPEDFGAFVDSVTDRYSEFFVLAGLLWYYLQLDNVLACMLVFVAAAGSVMVSYVRARAQSVGLEAKVGFFSRVERYLVIVPALIFNIPLIGIGVLALGTNFTALQRIIYVRRLSRSRRADS